MIPVLPPYPLRPDRLIYHADHQIVKFPANVSNRCKVCLAKKLDSAANVATLDCVLSIVSGPIFIRCYFGLKHTFISDTPNLYSIRYLPLAYLRFSMHKNYFFTDGTEITEKQFATAAILPDVLNSKIQLY